MSWLEKEKVFQNDFKTVVWVLDQSSHPGIDSQIKFLSAIDDFPNRELKHIVVISDLEVRDYFEVNSKDDAINQLTTKKFVSRGGTDFRPSINWIEGNVEKPLVLFHTDGFGPVNPEKPNFPICWVSDSNWASATVQYGETIQY